MDEFINPKSMVTPGVAGATMMFVANGVCSQFPEIGFRYVALVLSFAIGAIVFKYTRMRLIEKCAYWVVNSLIVFSMGVGSSSIARKIEEGSDGVKGALRIISPVSVAHADSKTDKKVFNNRSSSKFKNIPKAQAAPYKNRTYFFQTL